MFGPGALVAAAFVGPGTVTTATLTGVTHGVALLWALLFSVVATLLLQEMAARLGLVTGRGLGEAVRAQFDGPLSRVLAAALVLSGIAIGNAAFQTGNLLGGALGVSAFGSGAIRWWVVVIAIVAFGLLWTGSYRIVATFLAGLVGIMALAFVATAIMLLPSAGELAGGLLIPKLPRVDEILVVVGLIGTTVVPYNLFLHASAVRERWSGPEDLPAARLDAALAILIGGVVSMAIVVTSAGAVASAGVELEVHGAADMAVQLEPLLGGWAKAFFAVGLLAAGLSSAVTAPLAAAYATSGVLGWPRSLKSGRFRAVWLIVLLAGLSFAVAGVRPVPAILFAQVANGILLPAIAVFLLIAVNNRARLGTWANGPVMNLLGLVVVAVALALGVRALIVVF